MRTTSRTARALVTAALTLPVVGLVTACGQPAGPGDNDGRSGPDVSTTAATSPTATGAGGATTPGAQPTPVVVPPVTQGDVTLSATMGVGFAQYPDDPGIRRTPGLVVEYTVRNSGTESLVVHDRVPGDLGSSTLPDQIDPEHAWVYMAGDVLRVSKQGFEPTVAFFAAPVTGARQIPAGGMLAGRAVVNVPVELDVPSEEFDAPRSPIETSGAGRVWQFCLHVEPRSAEAHPSTADPDVLVAPVSAPEPGELLCTAPTPLVLP
ncbi:hypothetical protein [Intrasporangium sp.]|uniref:hypothetical protein n=1 Tax=Intrasporangium sp. TaxID=1925024 RepID=UPI00293A8376|nr:hypothetical protein [Intrasporangium sp.]MDV3220999.1 hypothetical protein [Intrasporangium sp.]